MLFQLAIVAIGCFAATGGQSQTEGVIGLNKVTMKMVCPLSEEQTQNAIDAFAKMVPVFHHKRCANCHGDLNPFSKDHPEGPHTVEEMAEGGCNECHSNIPSNNGKQKKWELALRGHEFGGKDAAHLCKMMRTSFDTAEQFLSHIQDEDGKTNFQAVAFLGTRGLNEYGQQFAFTQPYRPEPIEIMGIGEFLGDAEEWPAAMGGKFQGDVRCGCEPVHFAVRVFYHAMINVGPLQLPSTMGPVDVPITFHDDGSYEGTGTLPYAANGVENAPIVGPCSIESQESVQIKVSGKAVEMAGENDMTVELTNITPATGSTAVACPEIATVEPLQGNDKRTFRFHLAGKDGESSERPVPLGPVVDATVSVQLVDQDKRNSPVSE
jgi:hypothetical protein